MACIRSGQIVLQCCLVTRQAWVVCANMHVVLAHGRLKLCNPEGAVTAQLVGADDVH